MYEHISYEDILQRMLDRVPSGMDKREGSIIYDALAPCAVELQLMYIELDVILKETFADTSSREFLIKRAKERGITPSDATNAVLKGVFNMEIPIGSRFNCLELNYVATEKITDYEYKMTCETVGVDGNKNLGDLIPIDYIAGLTTAQLTEVLIPAKDEEDTESLRTRYFKSFDAKAYGGNIEDYLIKTNSLNGVGATKVTPVWNGGGTVKLTILDAEYSKATDTLIDFVQSTIDPLRDGLGVGIAPIGHIVTVDTPTEVTINVSTSITFDTGYSWETKKTEIENVISNYLLDIRKEWKDNDTSMVRIAQIESKIMNVVGVIDINNTEINGSSDNLTLGKYEIPIRGVVSND